MASLPLIRISPSEFQFTESKAGYSSRLRLTSLQQRPVGFKFKTNAPHKFLVKPVVCSLTKKGMTVDVIVKSTSPISEADRFLIQTVALSPDEADGLDSAKWRRLDPSRIMEDLIQCTIGRRASVSSQGSISPPSSPSLLAVSHIYDPQTQQHLYHQQQRVWQPEASAKCDQKPGVSLAKRVYGLVPGIDLADWSWSELALFGAICMLIGFFLPAIRYALM
ncbi:hypothetical protein GQ54DRAFT_179700 [Martensiomyces pterosporus]|nr:hypothetical protein GQ54DRAFT_179700 [Martensiomyces pterosporus]